jgi:hypothetical protein
MKTKLTLIRILGFLAIALAFTFSACKKDTDGTLNITGKWGYQQFQGLIQYEFKNDNSVEYNIFAADSVTKKIIGYRFKTIGKYKIKNDSLIMFGLTNYANPKNGFGPATELIPVDGSSTVGYTISLNSQKNKLSLYFTCPFNASCVPSPMIFIRQ